MIEPSVCCRRNIAAPGVFDDTYDTMDVAKLREVDPLEFLKPTPRRSDAGLGRSRDEAELSIDIRLLL